MLVDVGNGFPEVLEMMECGYFRLFELVVWLFIVVLSAISGHFRLFSAILGHHLAIFGYTTSFLLIFLH